MSRRRNPLVDVNDTLKDVYGNTSYKQKTNVILLPYVFQNAPRPPTQSRSKIPTQAQIDTYQDKLTKWNTQKKNEFGLLSVANFVQSVFGQDFIDKIQEELYILRLASKDAPYDSVYSVQLVYLYEKTTNTFVFCIPFFSSRAGILGANYNFSRIQEYSKMRQGQLTNAQAKAVQNTKDWLAQGYTFIADDFKKAYQIEVDKNLTQVMSLKDSLMFWLPLELYDSSRREYAQSIFSNLYIAKGLKKLFLFKDKDNFTLSLTLPTSLAATTASRPISDIYKSRLTSDIEREENNLRQKYDTSFVVNPFALEKVCTLSFSMEKNQESFSHVKDFIDTFAPNSSNVLFLDDVPGYTSILSAVHEMNQKSVAEAKRFLKFRDLGGSSLINWMQDAVDGTSEGLKYTEKDGVRITLGRYFSNNVGSYDEYSVTGPGKGFNINETLAKSIETVDVLNFVIFSIPLFGKNDEQLEVDAGLLYANLIVCGIKNALYVVYDFNQQLYLTYNGYKLTTEQYYDAYVRPFELLRTISKKFPIYINNLDLPYLYDASKFIKAVQKTYGVTFFSLPYTDGEKDVKQEGVSVSAIDKVVEFAERPILASTLTQQMGLVYKSAMSTGGIFVTEKPFNKELRYLLFGEQVETSGELAAFVKEFSVDQRNKPRPIYLIYPCMQQEVDLKNLSTKNVSTIPVLSYQPIITANALGKTFGSLKDSRFSNCDSIPTCILRFAELPSKPNPSWAQLTSNQLSLVQNVAFADRDAYKTPFNLKRQNVSVHIIPCPIKSSENIFLEEQFKKTLFNVSKGSNGIIVLDTLDASITRRDFDSLLLDTDTRYGNINIKSLADQGYVVILTGGGLFSANNTSSADRQLIGVQDDGYELYAVDTLGNTNIKALKGERDTYAFKKQKQERKQLKRAFSETVATNTASKVLELEKEKLLGAFVFYGLGDSQKLLYFGGVKPDGTALVPSIEQIQETGFNTFNPAFSYQTDASLRYPLRSAPTITEFRDKISNLTADADLMYKLGFSATDVGDTFYTKQMANDLVTDYPSSQNATTRQIISKTIEDAAQAVFTIVRNQFKNSNPPSDQPTAILTPQDISKRNQEYVQKLLLSTASSINSNLSLIDTFALPKRDNQVDLFETKIKSVFGIMKKDLQESFVRDFELYENISQSLLKDEKKQRDQYKILYLAQKDSRAYNARIAWITNRLRLFVLTELEKQLIDKIQDEKRERPARIFIVGSNYPSSQLSEVTDAIEQAVMPYQSSVLFVLDTVGTSSMVQANLSKKYAVQVIPYPKGTTGVTAKLADFITKEIDPSFVLVVEGTEKTINKSTRSIVKSLEAQGKRINNIKIPVKTGASFQLAKEGSPIYELKNAIPTIFGITASLKGVKIRFEQQDSTKPKTLKWEYQDYADPYDDFWLNIEKTTLMKMAPTLFHKNASSLKVRKAPSFRKRQGESDGAAETRFRKEWASAPKVSPEIASQLRASITEDDSRFLERVAAERYLNSVFRNELRNISYGSQSEMSQTAQRLAKKRRYKQAGGYVKQVIVKNEDTFRWVVPVKIGNDVQYMLPSEYNKGRNDVVNLVAQRASGGKFLNKDSVQYKRLLRLKEAQAATGSSYDQFEAVDSFNTPQNVGKTIYKQLAASSTQKRKQERQVTLNIKSGVADTNGFTAASKYLLAYVDHVYQSSPNANKISEVFLQLIQDIVRTDNAPKSRSAILRTPLFSPDYLRKYRETSLNFQQAATMFALTMAYLTSKVSREQPIELESFSLNDATYRSSRRFKRIVDNEIKPFLNSYGFNISSLYRYAIGELKPKRISLSDSSVISAIMSEGLQKTLSQYLDGDVPRGLTEVYSWQVLNKELKQKKTDADVDQIKEKMQKIERSLGIKNMESYLRENQTSLIVDTSETDYIRLYALLSPIVTQNNAGENQFIYDIHKLVDYGIRIMVYVYNSFKPPAQRLPMPPLNALGGLSDKDFDAINKALMPSTELVVTSK